MIKITQIDEKNFTVQEGESTVMAFPAVYAARATGTVGTVILDPKTSRNMRGFQAKYDGYEINGEIPANAIDAVQKLNDFVGNFKPGGGTPSTTPEYVNEAIGAHNVSSGAHGDIRSLIAQEQQAVSAVVGFFYRAVYPVMEHIQGNSLI